MKAQLCKTFGWTPSELAEEDPAEVLQMSRALALFENTLSKKAEVHARLHRARRR